MFPFGKNFQYFHYEATIWWQRWWWWFLNRVSSVWSAELPVRGNHSDDNDDEEVDDDDDNDDDNDHSPVSVWQEDVCSIASMRLAQDWRVIMEPPLWCHAGQSFIVVHEVHVTVNYSLAMTQSTTVFHGCWVTHWTIEYHVWRFTH